MIYQLLDAMYCIYVWRPLMEASSTLEKIRLPDGAKK